MNPEQLRAFWAFARGDTDPRIFEAWFDELDEPERELGPGFGLALQTADYRDEEKVWRLRHALAEHLPAPENCECPTIEDMSVIPMGSDMRFDKIFIAFERIADYGPARWWLHCSRCRACDTAWLIAQDDRIYDDYFLTRLDQHEVDAVVAGRWPPIFQTYEQVLTLAREISIPPTFFDPMSSSLTDAVDDMVAARPEITDQEIGHLLGIAPAHVAALRDHHSPS